MTRNVYSQSAPASLEPRDRFLPGVPGEDIERILDTAPGDEIASGKFDHPESSAALVANALGFFLHRAQELPSLPDCPDAGWPASSLTIEATVRFPWSGGRHPVLDCLVTTPSALIGIESKRFEPFRGHASRRIQRSLLPTRLGRSHEGLMSKFGIRCAMTLTAIRRLDAAQLVKHAFALRSEVNRKGAHRELKPILFYVHAEPDLLAENWAAGR